MDDKELIALFSTRNLEAILSPENFPPCDPYRGLAARELSALRARLTALAEENERLRKALYPFARFAEHIQQCETRPSSDHVYLGGWDLGESDTRVLKSHFFAASDAYNSEVPR